MEIVGKLWEFANSPVVWWTISGILAAVAFAAERRGLPRKAQAWYAAIGEARFAKWIKEAQYAADLKTPRDRQAYVIDKAKDWAKNELDDYMPGRIASMIVDFVYDKIADRLMLPAGG